MPVILGLTILVAGVAGAATADSAPYRLVAALVALGTGLLAAAALALLLDGLPRLLVVLAADVVVGSLYQLLPANVASPMWRAVASAALVGALTLLGVLTVLAVLTALIAWRARRQRDRIPEDALLASLVSAGYLFDDDPQSIDHPRVAGSVVRDLDTAATRFFLQWPRSRATKVASVDWQLRRWARRVVVDTRELQTRIAVGGRSNDDILDRLYSTIMHIVDRDPLDGVKREARWRRRGMYFGGRATLSWHLRRWSRLASRVLLGASAGAAGALVLAASVWLSVPQFMIDRGWTWLGNALTFDPDMRVFVAGIGLSLLAVAQRAWTRLR
jgi:hypothetical protein